jgi:hypothetical protein
MTAKSLTILCQSEPPASPRRLETKKDASARWRSILFGAILITVSLEALFCPNAYKFVLGRGGILPLTWLGIQ